MTSTFPSFAFPPPAYTSLQCGFGGGTTQPPMTGFYSVFEDGESLCKGHDVEVNLHKNAQWPIMMYGTKCNMHMTKEVSSTTTSSADGSPLVLSLESPSPTLYAIEKH
jgi:hypothetical protein